MISILSQNGLWKATVDEAPDGVVVEFFALRAGITPKPMGRDVHDMPFHVVRDRVVEFIEKMPVAAGVHTMPVRR